MSSEPAADDAHARYENDPELSWTTAPELVAEYLDALGIPADSETGQRARAYARQYDLEAPIGRAPPSIAAGSIYLAHFFERGLVLTQAELQEVSGTAPQTITKAYREIAAADGLEIAGGQDDEGEDDAQDTFGWRAIGVAGAVFGLGLAGIVWLWTGFIVPLVGGDPLVSAALVFPTAVIAVAALEVGLWAGEVMAA